MKYKHIPSFLHNFTDSFASLVNFSGGGYAMDEIRDFLRHNGRPLVVQWLPRLEFSSDNLPDRIAEAISRYARWVPRLANSMRVDPSKMVSVSTVFSLESDRVRVTTTGEDDRGARCVVPAKFWD